MSKNQAGYPLVNARTSEVLIQELEVADSFLGRFSGLQLRKDLVAGKGLILIPCASIHTCFMRFDLDLVMVDKTARVLAIKRGIKPWRAVGAPPQTYAVIEVKSGNLKSLEVGDRLFLEGSSENPKVRENRRSLRFLIPTI